MTAMAMALGALVLTASLAVGGQDAVPAADSSELQGDSAVTAYRLPAAAASQPSAQAEASADSFAQQAGSKDAAPPTAVKIDGEPTAASEPAEDDAAAPNIHVDKQGRVEMHVRDLGLASVLQMLSMQSQRNIVASKEVSGKVTANLYNVTFDEALTAILDANGAGWREHGNFIYVYTTEEIKQMEAAARQKSMRLFRLRYTTAAEAKELITPLLSPDGKITTTPPAEKGIAGNTDAAGGDNTANEDVLVVIDFPDRIEAIGKMLADIDVRPKQVLIEATILRAQLNEDNALGIDFNLIGGVDFQNVSSVSNPADQNLTIGALPPKDFQKGTAALNTDFAGQVPKGGMTFGIIHNNVAAFVRALEQVTDTNVLANPKVLTLNKQRGEVVVGRRDGYLTTTVTETSAVQNVEFLETGTQLRFRPFIGNDGYVRMEVHPEDSTGGLTAANLPFEQTTEVTTNIIVRDGHTILIGGLFREVTSASRDQVPIAGNIPVAGALFRNTKDNTQREEVIILLTVKIIKDPDCSPADGDGLAQDVERYRVGMRRGLQWWGRERLSQAHYHWAIQHLEHGHMGMAMWDLDLAINNNPKFLAAIKLKEELLDKREWDDEGSAIRDFIAKEISRESMNPTPMYGRPGPPFSFLPLQGPCGFEDQPTIESPTDGTKPESPAGLKAIPSGQGAS